MAQCFAAAMKTIKEKSKVKLHYVGTLEDGTVFDDSSQRQPLDVVVGSGQLIKGFDSKLVGMKEHEEKTFVLQPEEAYGTRHEKLVQRVPKALFDGKVEIKEGLVLHLKDQQGAVLMAKIAEVTDTEVVLDLNHPLAGKTLKFKIRIVSVE